MKILVDDVRSMETVDIIFRNPNVALDIIKNSISKIDFLYLDHDMGTEYIDGYQFIKQLLYKFHIFPKQIMIVSSNPVGRKNIENVLQDNNYYLNGFIWRI